MGESDAIELRAALERVNRRWHEAITRGDYGLVAELCTDDVLFMMQGAPIARGIPEILTLCEQWARNASLDETEETLACGGSGDVAFLAGKYTRRYRSADGRIHSATGKFLSIYTRRADARWRTHVVSVFADDENPTARKRLGAP